MINKYGNWPKNYTDLKSAKIVILPVPYDGTSTWIKGADLGPKAIFEASAKMELYDIETDSEVYRQGIFTLRPIAEKGSPEKMVNQVKTEVAKHIKAGKFMVLVGGEHSVSIGSIQAQAERHKNLSVLQLDAHADLRDEYYGSKYNHGCVMARVKEICPIVQVGIRSLDISEKKKFDPKRMFFAETIKDSKNWQDQAIAKLTDKVYLTIDIDVFDPSILPSTGTPEPGGLGWYEVLSFIKKVNQKKNIVAFDVVELCPNTKEKSSDFLAAKLIYKILSYKYYPQIYLPAVGRQIKYKFTNYK